MLSALLLGYFQVDRSGESAFQATLSAVSTLENRRVTVFTEGSSLQLDLAKGKVFRAEGADGWGDGFLVVSDGKSVLIDPLNDRRVVTVRDMPVDITTVSNYFGKTSNYGGPFLQMRKGIAGWDAWVAPDAEIRLVRPNEISIKTKDFGQMKLITERTTHLPVLIEYSANPTSRKQQQVFYEILPKGSEKSFRFDLPKGPFNDLRKKSDGTVGTIESSGPVAQW